MLSEGRDSWSRASPLAHDQPIITRHGRAGAGALKALDGRNARRLAIMTQDGSLTRMGRTERLLGVVGRYRDRAMAFVWRHKGALAVSTLLAAFLLDPEPFLDGLVDVGELAARPVTEATREVVRSIDWTLVVIVAIAALVLVRLLALLPGWLGRRVVSRSVQDDRPPPDPGPSPDTRTAHPDPGTPQACQPPATAPPATEARAAQ
jgi:hypothetical protein